MVATHSIPEGPPSSGAPVKGSPKDGPEAEGNVVRRIFVDCYRVMRPKRWAVLGRSGVLQYNSYTV
jgi:hypothetical protein